MGHGRGGVYSDRNLDFLDVLGRSLLSIRVRVRWRYAEVLCSVVRQPLGRVLAVEQSGEHVDVSKSVTSC